MTFESRLRRGTVFTGAWLCLAIGGWPCGAAEPPDYDAHLAALKKKLPNDEFTVVIERPFVVVGDQSPAQVRRHAANTVRWATWHLKHAYFDRDPLQIIDIWLFRDEESYEKHAEQLFGEKPDTPYGYYLADHQALVMNISTGTGTLVHEMVHAFMPANFPRCPTWLNEGLGSLYEQCGEENGVINGYTNWRLAGLQKAIGEKRLRTFAELCATTHTEFYEDEKGSNYAQARYLCYYLQERDVLFKFYRLFRERVARDPTGYETLQEVLGKPDMAEFQRRWEEYVLRLRFRG
jgi:hypothetical protein